MTSHRRSKKPQPKVITVAVSGTTIAGGLALVDLSMSPALAVFLGTVISAGLAYLKAS